ncbi:hypothetical protein CL630_03385 [bacterium]|nr:hypothetical protein [bacterium]|tara:strand:- start:51890 stop:53233 length:1344 start_codon:yes stop_codon:yes gene_type:complete
MFLRRRRIALLLIGDVLLLYGALFITIAIGLPIKDNADVFIEHLIPFSYLIALWVIIFFIAGLYDKETLFFRRKIPSILSGALVANGALAAMFFYLIPFFDITPKTNLFTYLAISFILILLWRLYGTVFISGGKKQKALIVGSGADFQTLVKEIANGEHYNIQIARAVDIGEVEHSALLGNIAEEIPTKGISLVIIDMHNEKLESILPHLYNLLFSRVRFLDIHKVYEEMFQRVSLSLIDYKWFLEYVSFSPRITYDIFKRAMDIIIGFMLGVISLVLYPFVYLAIKLDDGGKIFVLQRRVGKNNHIIKLLKFRTMDFDDEGKWETGAVNNVTRVGEFLRKTRIDELPQLWNVLDGSISLIGPRSEFPEPARHYNKEIPYYNIRYLIKPGLSGWAQLYGEHPHHGTDVSQTSNKLSYDLYYVKNRSVILDLEIALKTIKTLLSRRGV